MKVLSYVLFNLVLSAILGGSLSAASFIGGMNHIKAHASTVPANGDVNPYGVAVVEQSKGDLERGQVLVSNFNNSQNFQGTGTTIVQVSPGAGHARLFAHIDATKLPGSCPGGVGLTTALIVLRSGWVIVGSLPTKDGTPSTIGAGCLLVLNSSGRVVETLSGGDINGPWDMTALDMGNKALLFVTNVLNGTVVANGAPVNGGTVLRITLSIPDENEGIPVEMGRTIIGNGYGERTDPAALVIGPTGVGLASNGTLYVADSLSNRIMAIPNAASASGSMGAGNQVTINGSLNTPLGLAVAPNGDILTVNAADGNMVETTPGGTQVTTKAVDVTHTPGGGTLFGLAVSMNKDGVYFVNDGNNTLDLLH